MGELHCQQSRSGEIFSFNYDDTWLARPEVFAFDPDLALSAGHPYPAPDKVNFGIFLDSSPDRYGLTKEQTAKVHQQVQVAVATWRKEASRLRISRDEQDLMEKAFEH
jgi:serine/threonine-protein kinase HipA